MIQERMNLDQLLTKHGVSFPEGDIDFQRFKSFLQSIKFYKHLIPFLDVLKDDEDSDSDVEENETVELVYENFKQFNLYDVALMFTFEQMDVKWINLIDCVTLRKGIDAIIKRDKRSWTEIIFQRISKNTNTDRFYLKDFVVFQTLISAQSTWMKLSLSTKMMLSDLDNFPQNEKRDLLDWIRSEVVSIYKKNGSIVAQEYAFLINRSQNIRSITKDSFVKRYYDPCVCAYMNKFHEKLLDQFGASYNEKMKKIADDYL